MREEASLWKVIGALCVTWCGFVDKGFRPRDTSGDSTEMPCRYKKEMQGYTMKINRKWYTSEKQETESYPIP